MVGHQAIAADGHSALTLPGLAQHPLEGLIVSSILEELHLAPRAVHHMVSNPARTESRPTCHRRILTDRFLDAMAYDPFSTPASLTQWLMTPFSTPVPFSAFRAWCVNSPNRRGYLPAVGGCSVGSCSPTMSLGRPRHTIDVHRARTLAPTEAVSSTSTSPAFSVTARNRPELHVPRSSRWQSSLAVASSMCAAEAMRTPSTTLDLHSPKSRTDMLLQPHNANSITSPYSGRIRITMASRSAYIPITYPSWMSGSCTSPVSSHVMFRSSTSAPFSCSNRTRTPLAT